MAKLSHEDILAYLEEATILELNDLVKAIEEKFGVTAAAPVAAAAPVEAAANNEPSVVSVYLTAAGEGKTGVIKLVKEITGLALMEAKAAVDKAATAPSPIKENISVEEAEELKKKFVEAGATVEIK